ncbi:MAG: hypothetical protein JW751_14540 [Polyangiaceae bacterium]|nr:hypothetical protein [Polyangiaceae bacterium]
MPELAANPAFFFYSAAAVVWCLDLLALWFLSGWVRAKTHTTPNLEDGESIVKGAIVVAAEPPEVARALRAHQNAMATILPFLLHANGE